MMGNNFKGAEIVEIGIQIEINGKDFYDILVGKIEDEKSKGVFKLLSNEEKKHIIAFQGILNSIKSYEPPEVYPDEYFNYMNSLASQHVFTKENKGSEIAQKVESNLEAVDLAIGFEQDSIIFYDGMKKLVTGNDVEVIDKLIMQEQDHLRRLLALKETLAQQ